MIVVVVLSSYLLVVVMFMGPRPGAVLHTEISGRVILQLSTHTHIKGKHMKTSIKVILVCRNASGEPELFKGSDLATKSERDEGMHIQRVGHKARSLGYEVMAGFDQDDPASKQLLEMSQYVRPVFDQRIDMDAVLKGYLEAMIWTATDNVGDPMDQTYTVDDLGEDIRSQARIMIEAFVSPIQIKCVLYADLRRHVTRHVWEHLGHDLYLSSNGHGAGFFDRTELPKEWRDELQDAAGNLGEMTLYQDETGELYAE